MGRLDFETDGMRNGKPIYCPTNEWDCPYFGNQMCHIANPIEECDDFQFFWESWEEYDNGPEFEVIDDDDIPDDVDESNYDPYMGCDFFESDECF